MFATIRAANLCLRDQGRSEVSMDNSAGLLFITLRFK